MQKTFVNKINIYDIYFYDINNNSTVNEMETLKKSILEIIFSFC